MITVNSIGGGTLSAAIVAGKAQEAQSIAPARASNDADLSASVAAYLSLPGLNATTGADSSTESGAADSDSEAPALAQAASDADDGLQQTLSEFDEGLKGLVQRPETQAFQAKFGADALTDANLPEPFRLPGVDEHGNVRLPVTEFEAADVNRDGKVSEEELQRYQQPLTYRSAEYIEHMKSLADGPSAFSLTEASRAYGVVSAAAATA